MEKSDGTLKRLARHPAARSFSYFIGKIGQVLVDRHPAGGAAARSSRASLFGSPLPTEPTQWLTFAWVFVLGVITCARPRHRAQRRCPARGKSATAVIIPIVLVLQFISGVYLQFTTLPEWLQNVASVFPLKWIAQGMRAVFLPETFEALEQGGSWDLAGVAIALGIWLVVGLVLCRVTFRWIRKDS